MEQAIERRSLAGEWEFRATDAERGDGDPSAVHADDWLSAEVPGDVYHDLLRAGGIPDPFVGEQELAVQWVGETDWTYRRTIDIDPARLEHDEHRLVFEGLDTVATVRVDGEVVGRSENMHRRHAFDVGDALEAGENELVVAFESPVDAARERAAAYPHDLRATHYPIEQPHRNFLRKAQCQFGWDWGVCLPTVGIWRDVELVSFSGPRITDVAVGQEHDGEAVDLQVDVRVERPTAERGGGAAPDDVDGPQTSREGAPPTADYVARVAVAGVERTTDVSIEPGVDELSLELCVEDPPLWWPAGHGEQPLFDLDVTLAPANAPEQDVDAATERIGFREVELVREPDDAGESFGLEVNGRPVFAKGANWIPADGVLSRVDESDYRRLLGDAVAANANAIRVWGGGHYERDAFYDVCDELGLLVWQDFAFACACYPADDDFLEAAAAEARYQVRRLASHPSIALWCGNNETDELIERWYDGGERDDADANHGADDAASRDADDADSEYERLRAEYVALFEETLRDAVEATDPDDRAYWPSSPSSPGERPPNDPAAGDVHFWDVWHDGAPFEAYLALEPRFASEFGYQSFPSVETLRTVLDEDDLNPTAPAMEHHQRDPGGNGRILQRTLEHFRVPWSLERFVYLSQVQQAMAMRTAIEHWRRLQPHCAGTLYWQLNDAWPVASWSSIEYGGRWKALQYAARRFYAPVLVSMVHVDADGEPVGRGSDDAERVEVWLTSDAPEAPDGDVVVTAETFDGAVLLEERVDADVGVRGSEVVATIDRADLDADDEVLASREELDEHVLLRAEYTGPEESYPAFETLDVYKRLALPAVELDVAVEGDEVTVGADAAALYVHLDQGSLDGHFSDDYFHLAAGEERTVTFERRDGEERALEEELSVTHLRRAD